MKRLSGPKVGGVLALLLLGGLGAAAFAGQQTQRDVQRQLGETRAWLNDSGLARVETGPYRGHLLGGTQETVVTLLPQTAEPLKVRLVSHVHNGPFPQGRAFGAATVQTDVLFEPEVQQALDRAFGGQKINLLTRVQFGGASTTTFGVPAGRYEDAEEGGRLNWQALSGTVQTRGEQVSVRGDWPGLTLTGEDGGMQLGRLSWTSEGQQAPDGLGDNRSEVTLDRLAVTTVQGSEVRLENLRVSGQTVVTGGRVSTRVQYAAGQLNLDGETLSDLRLELQLKDLDRSALAELGQVSRGLSRQTGTPTPEELERLRALLVRLLAGGPELVLDRLSVGQGKDEVRMTGRVYLASKPGTDWNALLEQPAALMSVLRADVQARGQEEAVRTLLRTAAPEQAEGLLAAGEQNRLFTREGEQLRMTLLLDDQGMSLNGQRLD